MIGREYNEKALIDGLKRDSHESFRLLFDEYSTALFKFSMGYLKSTEAAEDIVQEVFVKVWEHRKNLKTNTSFKSYLFTIALNAIRKQFNKLSQLKEIKHDLLYEFTPHKDGFDQKQEYEILENKLNQLIEQLPEQRKDIFRKKKIEGKSLKEIADELNVTTKAVEYHITQAMKFLKEAFEKDDITGLVFFHLFV
ncbi:RNA polymerase sigma-70 factor [Puteibacter caeruleilacunae]|nr:RNA polymerase sigma-70 factor [Puteibacter caeruleilacunae]